MSHSSSLSGPLTFVLHLWGPEHQESSPDRAREQGSPQLGRRGRGGCSRASNSNGVRDGREAAGPRKRRKIPLSIPLRGQKKVKAKELLLAEAGLCGLCPRSRRQGAPRLASPVVPGPPSPRQVPPGLAAGSPGPAAHLLPRPAFPAAGAGPRPAGGGGATRGADVAAARRPGVPSVGPRLPARRPRASIRFVSRARPGPPRTLSLAPRGPAGGSRRGPSSPRRHCVDAPGRERARGPSRAPPAPSAPAAAPAPAAPAALAARPPARPGPTRAAQRRGERRRGNMATVPVYCVCRLPYDVTRFMIECDACKDWFHGR